MRRLGFPVPISILLFLALTFAGAYYVRRGMLERAMVEALKTEDEGMIRSLLDWWPCPVNATAMVPQKGVFGIEIEMPRTPFMWAMERYKLDVALACVLKGADVKSREPFRIVPLNWAVMFNDKALVRALLDRGADPNEADSVGNTALNWVVCCDPRDMHGEEMISMLLAAGANPRTRGAGGRTPLHRVAMTGGPKVVELLLEHGADVNATDDNGSTPLYGAGKKETVYLLLARGALVNVRNCAGSTPLHEAAEGFDKEAVEALIERGADVNCRDNKGLTPLDRAKAHAAGEIADWVEYPADIRRQMMDYDRRCKDEVIRLLLKAGARE